MSPSVATAVCAAGILGLFWLERDRVSLVSASIWIPVTWIFLAGSRSVGQWLDLNTTPDSVDAVLDGSPTDRLVYSVLLALGVAVVLKRRRVVAGLLRANTPVVLFFVYGAASILWSAYPDVAFKRWTKALGDFVMVLVVLSDADRVGAIKRLFARTAFLLIPVSILFIKYYPALGRSYSVFEGTAFYIGAATTKNGLGMVSLLFGLGALWCLLADFRMCSGSAARRRHVIADGTIFVMAVWLCFVTNSMTSLWCFGLGATVVVATSFRKAAKSLAIVHVLVGAVILLPFLTLFIGLGADLAHSATGRNMTTLTDRTEIWRATVSLSGNSLLGTGFDSFWLGTRLRAMWNLYWWHPNEAHNGYLEVFLNLGWLGVALLGIVIATGYRAVIAAVRRNLPESSLMIGLFAVGIVYNFTESAFFRMMTPTWIMFLLAITDLPRYAGTRSVARLDTHLENGRVPTNYHVSHNEWNSHV